MGKTNEKMELSPKETRIVGALVKNGGEPMSITELAKLCFSKKGKANSWVRNSLRRPRDRFGLAELVANGTYIATKKALKDFGELVETAPAEKTETPVEEKPAKAVAAKRVNRKAKSKPETVESAKTETPVATETKPEPEKKVAESTAQPTLF